MSDKRYPITPYFWRTLENILRDNARRKKTEKKHEPDLAVSEGTDDDPDRPIWDAERLKILQPCLDKLNDAGRHVIVGKYYEIKSYEELTAELGRDPQNKAEVQRTRQICAQARRKLRKCLEGRGVDPRDWL
jgi:RNA polymerase sigma factor (sigma-70 family)